MFARKKPAYPAETPSATEALNDAATPAPEAAAPAETSGLTAAAADASDEAATPAPEPAPVAATPAHNARPAAATARPKAPSILAGDIAFKGTLSGSGDVHLGGPFEGDINVRDVTVGVGGRVEGVITGRRIEVLGRVSGGLVADEVRVRNSAQVDADVTSKSFALDATAQFEGRSTRKPR